MEDKRKNLRKCSVHSVGDLCYFHLFFTNKNMNEPYVLVELHKDGTMMTAPASWVIFLKDDGERYDKE